MKKGGPVYPSQGQWLSGCDLLVGQKDKRRHNAKVQEKKRIGFVQKSKAGTLLRFCLFKI